PLCRSQTDGSDHLPRESEIADRKVLDRPGGGRTVHCLGGHLHLAHAVAFNPCLRRVRRHRLPSISSHSVLVPLLPHEYSRSPLLAGYTRTEWESSGGRTGTA